MAGARAQRISLAVVLVLAFLAAAWIASALWAGLLLGLLSAFAIEPVYRRLLRRMPRRPGLAAGISVAAAGVIAAGALAGLFLLVTEEALSAARQLAARLHGLSPGGVLGERVLKSLEAVGISRAAVAERIGGLADRAATWISSLASALLGSTLSLLGGSLVAFVTAFYSLQSQRPIERRLQETLPLDPRTTRELVGEFRKVGRGTLVGSVLAALAQGALSTLGYVLGGVPEALLLGAITAVASFVPVIGTPLVWVPVSLALLFAHRPASGIFELAWGALITIALVDYVVRPIVAGRESRSHPLLFLIGVLGGVEVLGAGGVIAGPILMVFFASVLRIYQREVIEPDREAEGDGDAGRP
jgi:predicted PurR-regulated permease PerM